MIKTTEEATTFIDLMKEKYRDQIEAIRRTYGNNGIHMLVTWLIHFQKTYPEEDDEELFKKAINELEFGIS